MTSLFLVLFCALAPAHAFEKFETSDRDVHVTLPSSPELNGLSWDDEFGKDGTDPVTYGVKIQGPNPYARNDGMQFTPASNTKLFTLAAALELLGPEFTFTTKVTWKTAGRTGVASELKIEADGDPTWGMNEYGESLESRAETIAERLFERGVRAVEGSIELRAADPRWDIVRYPQGWTAEDRTECYGALPQAFNVQADCATFVVTSPKTGWWREAGVPVPVRLEIKPGSRTALAVEPIDHGPVATAGYRITGTWKTDDDQVDVERLDRTTNAIAFRLPVHQASGWAKNLIIAALRARGIKLVHPVRNRRGPAVLRDEETVLTSLPLASLIKPFAKESMNHVGEALLKRLGQSFGPKDADLVSAGEAVMREFVSTIGSRAARAANIAPIEGFFSSQVTLHDGSGVSRDNLVTTDAVMALLLDLRASQDFPAVWDALPIAGVDGTLASRMKNTPAENVLRAKTGTLRGVYNLSGFVPRLLADGSIAEHVPFVILTKTNAANRSRARATQDRAGAALAAALNPGGAPHPFEHVSDVTQSKNVVFIGDSHSVGSFGRRIDDLLRAKVGADNVYTYASCGSSPAWFFTGHATPCGYFEKDPKHVVRTTRHATPKINELLSTLSPKIVVVEQGANLVEAPLEYARKTSRELAQAITKGGARCVWFGPPHGRNKTEPGFGKLYNAIEEAVSKDCQFIDSRPHAHYPDKGGDGVHYDSLGPAGVKIAEHWAEMVFGDIIFGL